MSSCRCTRHCECWDAAADIEPPIDWSASINSMAETLEITSKQFRQLYESAFGPFGKNALPNYLSHKSAVSSNKELFQVALENKTARKPRWTYQWDHKTHGHTFHD